MNEGRKESMNSFSPNERTNERTNIHSYPFIAIHEEWNKLFIHHHHHRPGIVIDRMNEGLKEEEVRYGVL